MFRSLVTVLLICLPAVPAAAQEKKTGVPAKAGKPVPSKEKLLAQAIPGYTHRTLEGFDLLINHEVLDDNNGGQYARKPVEVLERELNLIHRVLPARAVNALRAIVVWVEWEDRDDPDFAKGVLAKYYGLNGNNPFLWSLGSNKHPWKANNVEIINMHAMTRTHQPGVRNPGGQLLHELAHAVHFQLFGANNAAIRAAYQQARDRKLYDESRGMGGRKIVPYARTNDMEYFAELSRAYLHRLNYYPFTRDDLKKHDPVGYQLMELTWGKAKQLDAALAAEGEKACTRMLSAARRLQADGKKAEAQAALEKIIEFYPNTRAAPDAKQLLEKVKAPKNNDAGCR